MSAFAIIVLFWQDQEEETTVSYSFIASIYAHLFTLI